MSDEPASPPKGRRSAVQAQGRCVCGGVRFEIDVPAVWAWHDHGERSRHAQGCAYATYVGTWKSRFRMIEGEELISRYEEPESGAVRSFCSRCGAPLFYERKRSPKMLNIPRPLFETRTGREPRYHVNLGEAPDWAYRQEKLEPLKGYPGVMWERPRRSKRAVLPEPMF
jgi:hypothetical protein